jgi:hypothetical protein
VPEAPHDRAEADRLALADRDVAVGRRQLAVATVLRSDLALDLRHELLGLAVPPVDEQPAGALRHVAAHEQDRQAEDRSEAEREPPAEVEREETRVEQRDRQRGAEHGARPERAVDDQVHGPAHTRRDQLVDRGVDGRVLATDAGARM